MYKPEGGRPILDVELHWSADRLLFSGVAASNAWHVMELDLATRKVRQVTRDNAPDINHYDPCYVPDGRIIFTCTALKYAVPCVWGSSPVANLFRCNADGSEMELLCNDQEHAWCPEVMPDGRVIRGGSWYSRPKLATASFRRAYRPYAPVYDVGFRIAVEK